MILSRSAMKALAEMPAQDRSRLMNRLRSIAADPTDRHPGVIALQGVANTYRVRQGVWRAVFRFDGLDLVVDEVGHRKEIYR